MKSVEGECFTLRRADRLTGEDFVRAVRRAAAARTAHLRVHARENGLGRSRLGVSVGRRFGNAAARNRLKRLVREAFRTAREARAAGLDIVVVAGRREVLGRPEEIAEALALACASKRKRAEARNPPG